MCKINSLPKKTVLGGLAMFVLVLGLLVSTPLNTQAQSFASVACGDITGALDRFGAGALGVTSVPVNDRANIFINSQTAAYQHTMIQKECINDSLLNILAKQVIQHITASTVRWINSGFQGSPTFVQDPGAYFGGIASGIAGDFIQSMGGGFLCGPFSAELRFGLSNAANIYGRGLERRYNCTLQDIARNIDGFIKGNFADGGWGGWFTMTQNPQNNLHGAYLQATAEMELRMQNGVSLRSQELDWGNGFRSIRDEAGRILTPGTAIVSQLNNALGSDLRQLELADEINEITGALVGQLISQMMSGGLSGAGTESRFEQDYGYRVSDFQNDATEESDRRTGLATTRASVDRTIDSTLPGGTERAQNLSDRIAQGKPAKISTTKDNQYTADFAVDGSTQASPQERYARISATEREHFQWWQVDLEDEYLLRDIRLWIFTDFIAGADGAGGDLRIYVTDEEIEWGSDDLDRLRNSRNSEDQEWLSRIIDDEPVATAFVDSRSSVPAVIELPEGTRGRYIRILEDTRDVTNSDLRYIAFTEVKAVGVATDAKSLVLGGSAGEGDFNPDYDMSSVSEGSANDAFDGIKGSRDEGNISALIQTNDQQTPWWETTFRTPALINSVTIYGDTDNLSGGGLSSNDLLVVQILNESGGVSFETLTYADVRNTGSSEIEIDIPSRIGYGVRVLNWSGCESPLIQNESLNSSSGLNCSSNSLTFTEIEVRGAAL